MIRRTFIAACAAAFVALTCVADAAAQSTASSPLKVMSFNIRYGNAKDGDDHWDLRKDFLVDVLRTEGPDIVGLQEALHMQIAYILQALPEYAVVGVGRDDGVRAGEYTAILYRTAKFTLSRSDTFWYSDTPTVVASKTWGNNITRICTWAQFTTADGTPFYVYNTHLDHQSQPSREKSAQLLRRRIDERDPKAPVVVMGDFNAGEKNPAVASMVEGGVLVDSFRAKHPTASPVGTFTGFKYGQVNGEKIDHIFVSTDWEIADAAIVRTSRNQRYPSDHFPVIATLAKKR